MGKLLFHGDLAVASDHSLARIFLSQAKDGGVRYAQYYLALCLEEGLEGPADKSSAFKLYENAAQDGDSNSQFRLYLLSRDRDSPIREIAYDWLLRSVKSGNPPAEHTLGNIYLEISRDFSLAENYPGCIIDGLHDQSFAFQKAIKYISPSSDKQYLPALKDLGTLYESCGKFKQSILCYNKLLQFREEQSVYVYSLKRLSHFYLNGISVFKDEFKALELLEEASGLNDVESTFILGKLLSNRDPEKAINMLKVAASGGIKDALVELAYLLRSLGENFQKEFLQTIGKLADIANLEGIFLQAVCHLEGGFFQGILILG